MGSLHKFNLLRKPNNIIVEERKNLDKQTTSFSDFSNFNLGNINGQETEEEPTENEWTYSENFKNCTGG